MVFHHPRHGFNLATSAFATHLLSSNAPCWYIQVPSNRWWRFIVASLTPRLSWSHEYVALRFNLIALYTSSTMGAGNLENLALEGLCYDFWSSPWPFLSSEIVMSWLFSPFSKSPISFFLHTGSFFLTSPHVIHIFFILISKHLRAKNHRATNCYMKSLAKFARKFARNFYIFASDHWELSLFVKFVSLSWRITIASLFMPSLWPPSMEVVCWLIRQFQLAN